MTITLDAPATPARPAENPLGFVWLEITGKCQEFCVTCYADSSPQGTHGTMSVKDWHKVIRQLALMGVRDVQFIGGEPTLYPRLEELIAHAYARGLGIEVFSNLVHIRATLWKAFERYGVKLATSYYSDVSAEHDAVTQLKGSHKKTRANIQKAIDLGMPIRGGVITVNQGQRVIQAAKDLAELGVDHVGGDKTRAFGRASQGAAPKIADLCGHCALGQCAIGPSGDVWPCVLGRFISLGNVREQSLATIWNSQRKTDVRAEIAAEHGLTPVQSCTPPQFLPSCGPCGPCVPSVGHCDPQEAALGAATIATT
ncbi:radical SAM/SPASM domain-containing protein [Streptomyces lavendulae]|uniref:radical SAM/SPASM domain-containing protein n=1 Tax=Streptomyces lavendulae TaxID=1914 RepID=UPI0033FDA2E9